VIFIKNLQFIKSKNGSKGRFCAHRPTGMDYRDLEGIQRLLLYFARRLHIDTHFEIYFKNYFFTALFKFVLYPLLSRPIRG